MSHAHQNCQHHHAPSPQGWGDVTRLSIVLGLTFLYMIMEILGGLWSHSLALWADAGHMFTDTAALSLALFTAWMTGRLKSQQNTYGFYRMEILAAFINGVALTLMALWIGYEASQRLLHPQTVLAPTMTWIAAGGLVINVISAIILFQPGQKNLNMRAAWLHVLSDCLGSVGAIIAGILIWVWGIWQADPFISVAIAALILINAWKLLQETTQVLLEACPSHLNVAEIKQTLLSLPEIDTLHDLHVWAITPGKEALSVHAVVKEADQFQPYVMNRIQDILKERFNLTHITVQLEPPGFQEDDIHF